VNAADLARSLKAKRNGSGWIARCPAHDDRSPSLSIAESGDGHLLLHCHAGCTFEQILKAAGVEPTKRNGEDHTKPRIVATYDYHDAKGELIYQVVRYAPKDFRQRRPDGNGGWIWKMQGVERVPYRLPHLLNANEVFIVEGEKDADNLAKLGVAATTNPGGADKWPDSFGRWFDGRHAIILPDNDQPGRDHAQDVARKLKDHAASIRILDLPGLPPKGDVSDWIAAGGTADQLLELADQVPYWQPTSAVRPFYWTLDDIKNLEPPTWIIEGLLVSRTKALMFGESGHYKTMHAVDALCRVAHGMDYHGLPIAASLPVCFIANEDAYGMAVQRIQGWHLYHGRPGGRVIVMPCNTKLDQPQDVERAIACARDTFGEERPIFVIDTWDRSICGNPNSTEDVNPALNGLDALLAVGQLTLTLSHSPWSDKNRTKGAVTFWANHDTRIKVEKDETTGRGTLEVLHHKNARPGLVLASEFEQFDFEHCGMPTDTLIPRRDFDYQPSRKSKKQPLGSNEQLVLDALKKAIAEQADLPPPTAPSHARGCSVVRWQETALLILPQSEDFRKREAFNRALPRLVAKSHVQHVAGFAWLP
jgi:AAA domain